jgi:tetratricopeptide (TPR) repeat protein
MRVNRNYNEPFFGEKKKGFPFRRVAVLLVLFAGMLYVFVNQPGIVMSAVYSALGNAPTPTPLPREWIERAMTAYQSGDMEIALDAYNEAVLQRPDNIDYLYDYGQLLIDNNRAEEALTLANRIEEIDPSDVRGYALKARAMAWLGQSAAAIPIAIAGREIDPNHAGVSEALTRAYIGETRWRDALDVGLLATEQDPNNVRTYWAYATALSSTGNFELAIAELETATRVNPTFLPPYFELAFLYLALDRNQEAIDTYDAILGMQPRNPRALLRQCEAYRKVGEFNRALGLCYDATVSDPNFVPGQYRYGTLMYSEYRFTESRDAFDACLRNAPDNLECRTFLGLSHFYLGECDQARTVLNDANRIAQARPDTFEETLNNIQLGLDALTQNPTCSGFNLPPTATPTPTPTPGGTPAPIPTFDGTPPANPTLDGMMG